MGSLISYRSKAMNVSIITMTRTYNYGATMQAFALQTYVESLGHNCDIIDHMGFKGKHKKISLFDMSKSNILKIPVKRQIEKGYYSFESFYNDYMKMTRRYDTYEELVESPPSSDIFITGSDQVWNPRDPKYRKFFLEFVPNSKVKISYAASIGDPIIPDEKKKYYKKQLERFHSISVREKEGKKLIDVLTDQDVIVNCDPIFLIDKEKWCSIEKPIGNIKKPFILCYMIYIPEWYNSFIKELKRKTGLEVVLLGLSGINRIYADKQIRCAGPSEYLWLFDNAELIVSSSFHGNAFSILFEKKLISIPDPKRPDRIHNLLSLFGLESCELFENNISIIDKIQSIDREYIKNVIVQQQQYTKEYFDKAFL